MQKITDTLLALLTVLVLVSASVSVTLAFRPLYYIDIGCLHIAEDSGFPEEEIRANYDALIDYNLRPDIRELVFPTFPMSESARIHFQEVKRIFQLFLWTAVIGAPVLAAGILWQHKKRRYGYLKAAGLAAPLLVIVLGGAIALNWERVFVLFHELVFQNDYWIFDAATDPVITVLPDTFFMHCALLILALILAGSAICLVCARRAGRKSASVRKRGRGRAAGTGARQHGRNGGQKKE